MKFHGKTCEKCSLNQRLAYDKEYEAEWKDFVFGNTQYNKLLMLCTFGKTKSSRTFNSNKYDGYMAIKNIGNENVIGVLWSSDRETIFTSKHPTPMTMNTAIEVFEMKIIRYGGYDIDVYGICTSEVKKIMKNRRTKPKCML